MPYYRLAGHEFFFQNQLPILNNSRVAGKVSIEIETLHPHEKSTLISRNVSLIGDENRKVEVWAASPGTLLRVSGGSDFYITSNGEAIVRVGEVQGYASQGEIQSSSVLSGLDREILLGPALVLALVIRGTWSLHASAVTCQGKTIAFVGESGRGKSTLAAYLSNAGWHLVADDILPVTGLPHGLRAWPHFPQMKLPIDMQPGVRLPEHIPLNIVCELALAGPDDLAEVKLLPPKQAIRVLLSQVAGTRLFDKSLLEKHLDFCAKAAEEIPVYQLVYPHRKDALPEIKELLEKLC